MAKHNPLIESYLEQKESELDEKIRGWAHILRLHHNAAIKEGFTPKQAMQLLDIMWRQADDRSLREHGK